MEKEYYKNLAEKYFAGDITEAENGRYERR